MQSFRDLLVSQKAHAMTLCIYRETSSFPSCELYGLSAQVRRAAVSIGSNIAEGCGRNAGADFARFLQIAMGSASEVEYQLLLAHDLGYLDNYSELEADITEVKRVLASLIRKFRIAASRS